MEIQKSAFSLSMILFSPPVFCLSHIMAPKYFEFGCIFNLAQAYLKLNTELFI